MSTVGLQTDVSRVQVVHKTTYASVVAQTCSGVVPLAAGVDVEMGWMGGGPLEPPQFRLSRFSLLCLCLLLYGRRRC